MGLQKLDDNWLPLILTSLLILTVGSLIFYAFYKNHQETQEYLKQGYHWVEGSYTQGEWKK